MPHPYLAVQVWYLQSDQLYYLVLGIAVYMSVDNTVVFLTIVSLKYTVPVEYSA